MKNNSIVWIAALISISCFAQQKNVVLELFTSQGCSSCPKADELLKEISESKINSNVITLAYHVDYWNRLGWSDPFSKPSFTNYQQEYGKKFGPRSIYTPQLVINGKQHVVGSDKNSITLALSNLKENNFYIPIEISNVEKQGSKVIVSYKSLFDTSSQLHVVLLLKEFTTKVNRGENRNRTLLNTHIVLEKKTQRDASTSEVVFENVNFKLQDLEFVAYIQNKKLEIVGATQWK